MTMLSRLTEVLHLARMRGDWDDERVVLEVLDAMRDPTEAMDAVGFMAILKNRDMVGPYSNAAAVTWRDMIDAIRAEASEPAHTSSELEHG